MKETPLPKKDLAQYGQLALPLAFAGMPLYIHAPDFYAAQFGASLATIGLLLLLLRCIDAVQDPIIGRLSDRFAEHRGQILLIATMLLAASFAMLFMPLEAYLLPWFFVAMLLATTAFSTISINLNTIGGIWSRNSFEKTRITTMREAFSLVGLLIAVILPAALSQTMPMTEAFMWVSVVLLFIAAGSIVLFLRWYRRANMTYEKSGEYQNMWRAIRHLPKSTKRFYLIYAITMLASSMPALLVLFFIRDRLDAESYTGLFLLLYFLAGIAGMPLWQTINKHYDKLKAWLVSMLLAVSVFVWAFFLSAGDVWQYGVICVLSGIAFGADLALPPSILADDIQRHHTQKEASVQFGLFAFMAKAALAISSAIGLTILDMVGFRAAEENDYTALVTLSILYALIPCFIKLISALILWRSFHLLPRGDQHEI